jgi:flagellar hook protein FlgE
VGHDNTYGYCGKKGHWAHECRKKKRDEEAQAHITVGDEDEQSLLLAHDITINLPSSPAPVATEFKRRPIHFDEQRVYADLSSVEGHDHDRWVLNTGTMNHMSGSQEVFTELDMHVTDTVKFGDGSVTKIEGKGSILLTYKNGAHRTLTGVYLIP